MTINQQLLQEIRKAWFRPKSPMYQEIGWAITQLEQQSRLLKVLSLENTRLKVECQQLNSKLKVYQKKQEKHGNGETKTGPW